MPVCYLILMIWPMLCVSLGLHNCVLTSHRPGWPLCERGVHAEMLESLLYGLGVGLELAGQGLPDSRVVGPMVEANLLV
eukprot:1161986-Pelagomonas_calceolata.AAC.5